MNVLYSLYHIIPSQTHKHLQFYLLLLFNQKELLQWKLLNFTAFPNGEMLKRWNNLESEEPLWVSTKYYVPEQKQYPSDPEKISSAINPINQDWSQLFHLLSMMSKLFYQLTSPHLWHMLSKNGVWIAYSPCVLWAIFKFLHFSWFPLCDTETKRPSLKV